MAIFYLFVLFPTISHHLLFNNESILNFKYNQFQCFFDADFYFFYGFLADFLSYFFYVDFSTFYSFFVYFTYLVSLAGDLAPDRVTDFFPDLSALSAFSGSPFSYFSSFISAFLALKYFFI